MATDKNKASAKAADAAKSVDEDLADDATEIVKETKVRTIDHESFAHRLYVSDFNIAFVEKRRIWFLISGVLLIVLLGSMVFRGVTMGADRIMNFGVDFTGGSVFQVNTPVSADSITEYTDTANAVGLPDMNGLQVTTMGNNAVRLQMRTLTTDEVTTMRAALAAKAGVDPIAGVNYTLIGPSWGKQITSKGIQAMVIFLVLVALMIGLYFRNWKMSLAAMIGLFHDLVVVIGIYGLVGFTVSPATITGILTILGYSLYDNVVVFDKVRENVVDLERKDFTYSQAADLAVNQVFVRSINTTIVGVLPVLSILLAGIIWLGGQGPLPDLGLAMFVGMITGAWSSIFIATPILCILKEAEPGMKLHREGVERRMGKSQTQVMITTTLSEEVPALASAQVTTAAVPVQVRHAASAGRPQPTRQSRSQRKG
ncbi:MAG: protein translocase subunit SecF [Propionibacteriaceae bacterium]|nr:protein translocase subunit SecF [Propionibacteriaceae bacterium]